METLTKYLLVVDVDFRPSPGLYQTLVKHTKEQRNGQEYTVNLIYDYFIAPYSSKMQIWGGFMS
jgi:cellulose synthase/poly-beta-1,6-N-acetylglucosamine synthase-like glycosyltransferase